MADGMSTPIHSLSPKTPISRFNHRMGVLFKLHRQNLRANTGVFPGAEFDSWGEIVHLTEHAKVLCIIFQYIYARKHPKLKDLDFDTLMKVAEAAEKYEIYSAMNTCEQRLKESLPMHTFQVFMHATKYDYPELVDLAADILVRMAPLDVVTVLPSELIIPLASDLTTYETATT